MVIHAQGTAGHDMDVLKKAKAQIEDKYLGQGSIHTVMIGAVEKEGHETGDVGVVALVEEKIPSAQIDTEILLPPVVVVDGQIVKVDVQEVPQPKDQRLFLDSPEAYDLLFQAQRSQAGESWQSCHDCPIPGGVQIAPDGAGWVGTLSCALKFINADGKLIVGAMSNYHVAVSKEQRGVKIGQPSGSDGDWFAKLDRWSPMTKEGNNQVDAAMLDTWRSDGKYAPGQHTVGPTQFKLGDINPSPYREQVIGTQVHKSGRTTGYQTGRVVGIDATSNIDYGAQGVLRFVNQTVIRGDSGDFSRPGDSGSLVLTRESNRPTGLLFAGGGGTTIINPIGFVMDMFGIQFFGP
jgi:hypothetical protein